jgi:DNA methylase
VLDAAGAEVMMVRVAPSADIHLCLAAAQKTCARVTKGILNRSGTCRLWARRQLTLNSNQCVQGGMGSSDFLRISRSAQARLIAAARDTEPVRGLTHGYYKYPARFSPTFARAAIETFTKPGELVLDPHVGGGTSLVEARAAGREAVACG